MAKNPVNQSKDIYEPCYYGDALHGGDPEAINRLIYLACSSQSRIARRLGVSRSMVNQVVKGTGRSEKVENAIADITEEALSALFPNWYV